MLIPILDSDWSQISQEFNKNFEQMRFFRTEKQCKERWFNHLSPFLNKYFLILINNQQVKNPFIYLGSLGFLRTM